MTEQPDDREPPQLQDTAERAAVPLPVPGGDEETAGQADWTPPGEEPAPIEEPAPSDEPAPIDEPQPADEPTPADKSATVEEPASDGDAAAAPGFGEEPTSPPSFPPPFGPEAADEGVRPEILVGAAFLGGVALAFLIKRLGN